MAQDTITRAELDADQARQEVTSTKRTYPGRDEFLSDMRWMNRRLLFAAVLATGLIIGAMQIS